MKTRFVRALAGFVAFAAMSGGAWAFTITALSGGSKVTLVPGQTYTDQNFASASGGTAPYTFLSATGLPAGITLDSNGKLDGSTCDANGSYNGISVTARDSTGAVATGTGFSLIVASTPGGACVPALTPIVPSATFPTGTESVSYPTLASPGVTVSVSGTYATVTYAIVGGSLPAGMTFTAGGDGITAVIAGTPNPGTAGTYSVTIQASSGGSSGTATFTFTINPDPASLAITTLSVPNGTRGTAYPTTTLATNAAGGTTTFAVTSGTFPTGMTLSSGGVLGSTPTVPGLYTFTVTATNVDGLTTTTATRTYSILVAGSTAISPGGPISAVSGRTFSQQFSTTGGTAPYTYSATNLPAGVTMSSSGLLSGRIAAAGTYTVFITSTDSTGAQVTIAVDIVVSDRPDPTTDTRVIGLINSQVAASARFADMQSDSVMSRLDASRECLKSGAKVNVQANTTLPVDLKAENCSEIAVWGSASVSSGTRGADSARNTGPSLTVGVDRRLGANAIVGVALGHGSNTTKIEGGAAQSKADFSSLALYGSVGVGTGLKLDGVLGRLNANFDTGRAVVGETLWLTGSRDGSQTFARARLSGNQKVGDLGVMPYGYVERGSGTLDGYTETGDTMLALNYGAASYSYSRVAGGVKLGQRIMAGSGVWEPSLKFELRRTSDSAIRQTMSYVDIPGVTYTLVTHPLSRNSSALGLGLTHRAFQGVTTSVGYQLTQGSGSVQQRTLGVNVSIPLK